MIKKERNMISKHKITIFNRNHRFMIIFMETIIIVVKIKIIKIFTNLIPDLLRKKININIIRMLIKSFMKIIKNKIEIIMKEMMFIITIKKMIQSLL